MKGNVQLMRTINFIIVIIYIPIIAFYLVMKITLNKRHIRKLKRESLLKIGFKEREPKPIIKEEDKYDEDGNICNPVFEIPEDIKNVFNLMKNGRTVREIRKKF
jgi:hypothetical protein